MVIVVEWRREGVDIYARPEDSPWGSQGGAYSNPTATITYYNLLNPKINILIDNNGHACLANFNPLMVSWDQSAITFPAMGSGTLQWMSPELFDPIRFGLRNNCPTKESDYYALGMVVYEVLSGRTPFSQHYPSALIIRILDGERPPRPQGEEGKLFSDRIWRVLELCWEPQPGDRIDARAVLLGLEESPSLSGPPSDADAIDETDTDDQSYTTASDSSMCSAFHPGSSLFTPTV